jgi:hypothetical protein
MLIIASSSKLEYQSGSLSLDDIVQLLPMLSRLDHKGILCQIINEVGSGLQEPYTNGEMDWSYEPDSYEDFELMDASLVSSDVVRHCCT